MWKYLSGYTGKEQHTLGALDWKKIKKDLKKFGASKLSYHNDYTFNKNIDEYEIDEYVYAMAEDFAKLILNIPMLHEYSPSFTRRKPMEHVKFRDELSSKLNEYVVDKKFVVDIEAGVTPGNLIVSLTFNDWPTCTWCFKKI